MRFTFMLALLAFSGFSNVQSSSRVVQRRNNEVLHDSREHKSSALHRAPNYAKHADRKHHGNSSRRLFGRHVCTHSKVTMLPVKDVQSYCKPVYQSYLRKCDRDNSRYCPGYRVVYETAFRTVQMMAAKKEFRYSCCLGWAQSRSSASDCKKAICKEECQNGGTCTKPDHCSCVPGWTGKTCETDVDECSSKRNTCEYECINTPGSFKCSCRTGFSIESDGRTCKKKVPETAELPDAETNMKMELLQKRLDDLEDWQRRLSTAHRHERDDRIISLSEQMALLEERLEECSCNRRNNLDLPRYQK